MGNERSGSSAVRETKVGGGGIEKMRENERRIHEKMSGRRSGRKWRKRKYGK